MKEFKIRCSAIGKIMAGTIGLTDAQQRELDGLLSRETMTTKQGERMAELRAKQTDIELPQGVKSYCQDWVKEQEYNRRKEFQSKYTQKGLIMEDDGIDMIGRKIGETHIVKNELFYENEFMTGTPDIILFDTIADNKCSWDCFTFPLFEQEIPNMDYWWQGQGYMHLTGCSSYKLCYTLVDTPIHLIQKQAYYYASDNGFNVDDVLPEFIEKMTYGKIDEKMKIKVFDFDYDPQAIKKIEERVLLCRNYITSLVATL